FPPSDRVAPPGWKKIVRMLAAIHIDHTMSAGVTGLMKDVDLRQPFRRVRHREFPGVRIDSRHTHRQTSDVGLFLFCAFISEFFRPRQQWTLAWPQSAITFDVGARTAVHPWAGQFRVTVGQPRYRAFD